MTTKKAEAKKAAKKAETSATKEAPAPVLKSDGREGSISFVARQLIKVGKSNDEVFEALVKEFGKKRIGEKHRSYPQWYRRPRNLFERLSTRRRLSEGRLANRVLRGPVWRERGGCEHEVRSILRLAG